MSGAIIGVDFDNTIVSYDEIFHRVALERRLVPPGTRRDKESVRNVLRAQGMEDVWTSLQGEVYGSRMGEVPAFPGAVEFFRAGMRKGLSLYVISHKTRTPYSGDRYDLHGSALGWLERSGFFASGTVGLGRERIFFEETKKGKLDRIRDKGCTHFVDDLPEFLLENDFPRGTRRLLFAPAAPSGPPGADGRLTVFRSWAEIGAFFGLHDPA